MMERIGWWIIGGIVSLGAVCVLASVVLLIPWLVWWTDFLSKPPTGGAV